MRSFVHGANTTTRTVEIVSGSSLMPSWVQAFQALSHFTYSELYATQNKTILTYTGVSVLAVTIVTSEYDRIRLRQA